MVERVMNAVFLEIARNARDVNCCALQNGRIFFDGDFDAKAVARASIEAMRDPTPAVVEAMKGALHNWREGLDADERMLRHALRDGKPFHSATDDEKHAIRWRAAIDAALAEIPPSQLGAKGHP